MVSAVDFRSLMPVFEVGEEILVVDKAIPAEQRGHGRGEKLDLLHENRIACQVRQARPAASLDSLLISHEVEAGEIPVKFIQHCPEPLRLCGVSGTC